MQEEHNRILAELNCYSALQRRTVMVSAIADFILHGAGKAAELEKAGYPEQAAALRAQLAEMMPDIATLPPPALPGLPQPIRNGTATDPLARPRRGRPPKGGPQS